ncbi:hypothetical protein GCM10010377_23530 [Streptomyces viridiviolaceus]|nr:hypothetical protein GCM10010377_23530 [Streptomyces viridiviolaceus]
MPIPETYLSSRTGAPLGWPGRPGVASTGAPATRRRRQQTRVFRAVRRNAPKVATADLAFVGRVWAPVRLPRRAACSFAGPLGERRLAQGAQVEDVLVPEPLPTR